MGKEKKIVQTNWTEATTSISVAMANLVNCTEREHNAWLEIRDNGDQAYPIMKVNPLLDNPFNWYASHGILRNQENISSCLENNSHPVFKDLTLNYTQLYGREKAIKKYQKTGEITDELNTGMGIPHPVKIKDAVEWADKFRNNVDKEIYKQWVHMWTPKEGIPRKIVDTSVGKVFVVCYDDSDFDEVLSLNRTAKFLTDYTNSLKTN